jgi:hypothetical protein
MVPAQVVEVSSTSLLKIAHSVLCETGEEPPL